MKTTALLLTITVLAAFMTQEVYAENESRYSSQDSKTSNKAKRNALGQIVKLLYQDLERMEKPWDDEKRSDERRESETSTNFQKCVMEEKSKAKQYPSTEKENPQVYYDMISLLKPFLVKKGLNAEENANDEKNKSAIIEEKVAGRNNGEEEKIIKDTDDIKDKDDESTKTDCNNASKHFLLSLLEDFDAIPKKLKVEAKYDILSVLKKYSQHIVSNTTTTTTVVIAPRALLNRENQVNPSRLTEGSYSDPSVLSEIFS